MKLTMRIAIVATIGAMWFCAPLEAQSSHFGRVARDKAPMTKAQCEATALPEGRKNDNYCYGIPDEDIETLAQCARLRVDFSKPCTTPWFDLPLHEVVSKLSEPMFEIALAGGADIRVLAGKRRETLIHTAVYACQDRSDRWPRCIHFVKRLMALGLDLNGRNGDGASAIWYTLGNPKMLAAMIALGADVNSRNKLIRPLDAAPEQYLPESRKMLIAAGAKEAGALARGVTDTLRTIESLNNIHTGH